ncbi:MAG: phytanoyl-CoA dioxygenase family protein [Candidatus Binatia bacterium]|nr:phytanoyl-CoA dioxygenase family protein [Candidatus Binatia bacterium]
MGLLNAAQQEQWKTHGYFSLPGELGPETVQELTRWVEEVASWSIPKEPGLHHTEDIDGEERLARSEDFDPYHAGLSAFMRDGVIARVLEELFGEPAVLFKEKINFKYPGGGGFAPHQDAPAYRFIDHHISCMVPIDPSTIESGCLYFAPGYDEGLLPNAAGRIDETWLSGARWEPLEAMPGDLVFFDSYAPHKSGTNGSKAPRRLMYLTYNSASKGDFRETYYADKRSELRTEGQEGASGHVRISINDDFLGKPVTERTQPR